MEAQNQSSHHLPVYNIKAISRLVGLLPVTLRAWERRYGIPSPQRDTQGYRLYSEYDRETLCWLKSQIDSGLSISRAVEYLIDLKNNGQDPVERIMHKEPALAAQAASLAHLAAGLLENLIKLDEAHAEEILQQAFGLYTLEQILGGLIPPVMVEIGERWQRGKIPVATEHYATQFFTRALMTLLSSFAPPVHPEIILAACAPGEMHQLGLLLLVVLLRWKGWNVLFFGPDLTFERLEETLVPLFPKILMFTATSIGTAQALNSLPDLLENLPPPHPIVILGGQAFRNYRLPANIPAEYIEASSTGSLAIVENLLRFTRPADPAGKRPDFYVIGIPA